MEKDIERYVKHEIEKLGGRCLKWVCPGNAGVPDRIVMLPGGWIWFAEFKDEHYAPTPLQEWWGMELDRLGENWFIIRGMSDARAFVQHVREALQQEGGEAL